MAKRQRLKLVREYAPGKWVATECIECSQWEPGGEARETSDEGYCQEHGHSTDCEYACKSFQPIEGLTP